MQKKGFHLLLLAADKQKNIPKFFSFVCQILSIIWI